MRPGLSCCCFTDYDRRTGILANFVTVLLIWEAPFFLASDDDISLDGLEQELQDYKTDNVCIHQFSALCFLTMFVICPNYLCCLLTSFCSRLKVVTIILSQGTASRNYTKDVEHNLRRIELDSIQVLIKRTSSLFLYEA